MTVKIDFIASNELSLYPPIPAKNVMPEWYKKIDSYIGNKKTVDHNSSLGEPTIKKCMPVFDAITAGYIMFTQIDYFFKIDEYGRQVYNYANSTKDWAPISVHNPEAVGEYPNLLSPAYRVNSPWTIRTPKGYSIMVTNPLHRDTFPIKIFEAVVDTDKHPGALNFPFTLTEPNFEGLIPAGTPIAQIIPFKRDNWEMNLHDLGSPLQVHFSKEEKKTHSVFWNFYKNNIWTKKRFS
jgi:hypothetical protein